MSRGTMIQVCHTDLLIIRKVNNGQHWCTHIKGSYAHTYLPGILEIPLLSVLHQKRCGNLALLSLTYCFNLVLSCARRPVLHFRCLKLVHKRGVTWQQYVRTHITSPITGRNPMAIDCSVASWRSSSPLWTWSTITWFKMLCWKRAKTTRV